MLISARQALEVSLEMNGVAGAIAYAYPFTGQKRRYSLDRLPDVSGF
jgi:hypothetical protein